MEQLVLALALICKLDGNNSFTQGFQKECVSKILSCYSSKDVDYKIDAIKFQKLANCLKEKP